jgi:hypothetical protein
VSAIGFIVWKRRHEKREELRNQPATVIVTNAVTITNVTVNTTNATPPSNTPNK